MALLKILVIDDEPDVLDMIRSHFSLRGYEVETASDGQEGIAKCGEFQPDVILLDFKMKTLDGDQAIPELKLLAPQAKLFLISAYQDEVLQKRLAGLPIDGRFEKPVSILELEKAIRAFLEKYDRK